MEESGRFYMEDYIRFLSYLGGWVGKFKLMRLTGMTFKTIDTYLEFSLRRGIIDYMKGRGQVRHEYKLSNKGRLFLNLIGVKIKHTEVFTDERKTKRSKP